MRSDATGETLRALRRLVRVLRLADRAAESRFGISAAQLFVLERLAEGPLQSLSELAERTMTDASSVSVVVQKLTEQGLVLRATDPEDARRATLRLSTTGRKLLLRAPTSPQSRIVAALEVLGPGQRRQLAFLLEQTVRGMGLETGEPPMFFEGEPTRTRATRSRRSAGRRRRRGG
jgi:DNA-binding MarR family transcriptional regulator